MRKALAGLVWVVLGSGALARAQVVDGEAGQTATLKAGASLVLVPTTVRTKKGEPVFTLKAEDFSVTDDGVPQEVRLEEDSGALPLALVVVLEVGGSGIGKLDDYSTLGTMVETIVGGVPHRLALVEFDSEPAVAQDWTESTDVLTKALNGQGTGDGGGAVLDALAYSVNMLKKQPVGYRRMILLVGETVDHGSHVGLEEAVRAVSDSNTVVYSLGFSSTRAEAGKTARGFNSTEPGPPHGCMGKDADALPGTEKNKASQAYDCVSELLPPLRLAKIAFQAAIGGFRTNVPETAAKLTGGEYFHFEGQKGLEKGLEAISNRLPNRYFLSFQPVQPHAGLHAIGVELKDYRGLVVEARKSYWAEGIGRP